ncbi:ubiquitin-associated domain-containing protein 1 [Contarinia nasturtii]|uniref:ubiquitin-associated domain-containing protein 1 n=1 Tax=Contarinia nasturtii TaxID=265458 RepID=UPI0012D3D8AE|nr:ubiquitin-associated domain-containing protein 1 [Contarinia nasturtii]
MLSWVRDKLAEGRLRWQQGLQHQQQRNSISPPPLPPPNAIDSPPVSTPSENPNDSDENSHHLSQQPVVQISASRPNASLTLQLQECTLDTIKPNGSNKKRLSHISRGDQGIGRGFCSSQYELTSICINRRSNDLTVPTVNLRIFNCTGSKCTICAPVSLTFTDIKRKVVAEFYARRQLFLTPCLTKSDCMPSSSSSSSNPRNRIEEQKMSCDNLDLVQLSRHYKLARISKLHENFDEHSSLATANVQNNEEMLLILCSNNTTKDIPALATNDKQSTENSDINVIKHKLNYDSECDSEDDDAVNSTRSTTQEEIDMATAHLQRKCVREPNVVNIDELVLQSDVQYDIRKILISLANSCAYVIGAGPYGTRIISMLKQRLVQRKKHEQDTQQCLIEMGFSGPKVQYALNINNNVYAAALEWLIENQSPTNPLLSTDETSTMNLSSKFTNNASIKDNIESLLEIIRIYCQRDLPPPAEMIQFIVGMGFDEATAYEALKITKNHQSNACEWLVGDRSKIHQFEQIDGLPTDSPILAALLTSPHIQLSLSNPKIFIAYLSILEDYGSMSIWMNDMETSTVIGQLLRIYHEEKHIMAINQFSQK